jgi:hypothetical protein
MHKQAARRGTSVVLQITVPGTPPGSAENFYRVARNANGPTLVSVDDAAISVEIVGTDRVYSVPLSVEDTLSLPTGPLYHELYEVANGTRNVLLPRPGHENTDRLVVVEALIAIHATDDDPE